MTDRTLLDLFENQVTKSPNHIAVQYGEETLTYYELNAKSNQLANSLIKRGLKKDELIPICVSRSFEMIIGIIAILKSGSAYVPIDPSYPISRKLYIVNDVNARFVLTTKKNIFDFPTELIVDITSREIESESTENPNVSIDPKSLAYIIYTSGTTGNPKGVMIEHHAVSKLILGQTALFNINSDDKILQFSNFCFDASVEQIFLSLLNGATLTLVNEETIKDNELFTKTLNEKQITHLHATPGILENLDPRNLKSLKRVIAGGDVCRIELAKKWASVTKFYNEYGPTEITVTATAYLCNLNNLSELTITPIGKPLVGLAFYILDNNLNQVKDGEIGELYIGGDRLARGYHNLPDITAKAFLKNPFLLDELIYKTGDLVKTNGTGDLLFLGRADDQVKIRGFRIELGEIESKFNRFSEIKQCVVLAHDASFGEKKLIAYYSCDVPIELPSLTTFLHEQLPIHMIPSIFIRVNEMPLTKNGKIDKNALAAIKIERPALASVYKKPKTAIEEEVYSVWSEFLEIGKIGVDDNFFELGGDSLMAQRVVSKLKQIYSKVTITKLYQFPTIFGLANYISEVKQHKTVEYKSSRTNGDIAVIGMAGRFPGANTIDELWDLLIQGKETTTFFDNESLDPSIPDAIKNDPSYVKARGIIADGKMFDPAFFGINPKLAELMDPQQRVFLEIAYEALEKSGHLPTKYNKRIGVFAGAGPNTYYENNVLQHPEQIENQGKFQVNSVNDKDFLPSRTSYHLNLKGPSVSVNSACSTSLLAIAEAVNSLRVGQCEVALAGAASVTSPINSGHLYQEGSMLSSDGHCTPFNADSTGTVFSDGAGVVVLKCLEDARRDGDYIFAIIKGIGINNDGGGKGSFTAPSVDGQADAIISAIKDANVNASDISYIEAHGTATPLGDPIEFDGLVEAFGNQEQNQFCAIGSIKSNFGHLTHAAGVAGFIKTCLALHHKMIPASLGYNKPNPHIDFKNSPFYVNASLNEWTDTKPRLAGVSSFGVGGTNVHVVLESYESTDEQISNTRPFELIRWSAENEDSLSKYEDVLALHLAKHNGVSLADIAYTLHTCKKPFKHRKFVVASSNYELGDLLEKKKLPAVNKNVITEIPSEVVFTFPGQGTQYVNMGLELYAHEAIYKDAVDECAQILQNYLDKDIREIIFSTEESTIASNQLKDTKYTQPALFVTEYALAQLYLSLGIKPSLFLGHSIGEYVAAHLSGIFSLENALKMVATRGKLISKLPSGSMLSVRQKASYIQDLLLENLDIAVINGPMLCVVSGATDQIAVFSKLLDQLEIANKPLFTSHAFHSSMMNPILEEFSKVVSEVELSKPNIKIISTVTGKILTDEEALDRNYWTTHLRNTVQFEKAVEQLLDYHAPIFLEIGPGKVTSTLIKQIAVSNKKNVKAIASLEQNQNSLAAILSALGQLWINGIDVDWEAFYTDQKRIELPTYQFNRQKYWLDPKPNLATINPTQAPINIIAAQIPIDQTNMRKENLTQAVKQVLEDASGIDLNCIDTEQNFLEIGLDSLLLTQVAISLKRKFDLPITFRKLNEEYDNISDLVNYIDSALAPEDFSTPITQVQASNETKSPTNNLSVSFAQPQLPVDNTAIGLIAQQLNILTQQLVLLQGQSGAIQQFVNPVQMASPTRINTISSEPKSIDNGLSQEEKAEIQKPFGATPKIERQSTSITSEQKDFLKNLTERYNKKTAKSKAYTNDSRPFMADPRVVSGFKPATKELVYPIVINKSKGSKLWDLDGNEYIDALNGFGSNMLGHQPDAIKDALHVQLENGYEVGPQHELAASVCKLICEFTNFDRSALCSTGSEAVLGCIRIARTVTARSLIVSFTGSYHGIIDEVLVRGTKKLKSFPAAAGIMPEAVENILVLDYGTQESLAIIKERGHEIAAVLVETIQSRRPEFVPVEFLKELREITKEKGAILIFDEVITGFRFHPGGAQAIFGIKADLAAYGKVVGAGMPIGVIAGDRNLMDALDGGNWQYGDDSIPEIGVTYFAGTFVRHPLALASSYASLTYMKERGPALQKEINEKGDYISKALNQAFEKRQLPIFVANYGSLWKVKYHQELPYSELMFVLLREKGIHILDGFPCFMTEATSLLDIEKMIVAFTESMDAMIEIGFFPSINKIQQDFDPKAIVIDANNPPVLGAKLGKDKNGNPAWFINDPEKDGRYLQIGMS